MNTWTSGRESGLLDDIIAGRKTIEGRLNRDKFAQYAVGDTVSLRRDYRDEAGVLQDGEPDAARVKIVAIRQYKTFLEMTKKEGYKKVIPSAKSAKEAADEYNKYYSAEDQAEYGVLAIEIVPIAPKNRARRIVKWALLSIAGLIIVGVLASILWATNLPPVGQLATASLENTDTVTVVRDDGVTFVPADPNGIGFVVYPGAIVPPTAYTYVAHQIAAQGFTVFVPALPLNLAVFDINAASSIIDTNPSLSCWVVGGHSLGGAMAAEYAKDDAVAGLVFWASYPAESNDLSQSGLKVASISGTLDGLSTPEKIEASKKLLPSDTLYTQIKGGNHARFGDYGKQSGDNNATISLEDQQGQIVEATLQLLEQPGLCPVK